MSPVAPPLPTSRASLEQAKIIPDILDRVSAASQAQLVVEFQGKAVQVGGAKDVTQGAPC